MRIKYQDETNTKVCIAKDDVNFNLSNVGQNNSEWNAIVQPHLDSGGVIEPYVAPEKSYTEKRMEEYGSVQEQFEFITENGLTAWQTKVAEIKARHPKK